MPRLTKQTAHRPTTASPWVPLGAGRRAASPCPGSRGQCQDGAGPAQPAPRPALAGTSFGSQSPEPSSGAGSGWEPPRPQLHRAAPTRLPPASWPLTPRPRPARRAVSLQARCGPCFWKSPPPLRSPSGCPPPPPAHRREPCSPLCSAPGGGQWAIAASQVRHRGGAKAGLPGHPLGTRMEPSL